jgi:hypothetical protein
VEDNAKKGIGCHDGDWNLRGENGNRKSIYKTAKNFASFSSALFSKRNAGERRGLASQGDEIN